MLKPKNQENIFKLDGEIYYNDRYNEIIRYFPNVVGKIIIDYIIYKDGFDIKDFIIKNNNIFDKYLINALKEIDKRINKWLKFYPDLRTVSIGIPKIYYHPTNNIREIYVINNSNNSLSELFIILTYQNNNIIQCHIENGKHILNLNWKKYHFDINWYDIESQQIIGNIDVSNPYYIPKPISKSKYISPQVYITKMQYGLNNIILKILKMFS